MKKLRTTLEFLVLFGLSLITPTKLFSSPATTAPTVLELDLLAFKQNIFILKKVLQKSTLSNHAPPKICAVFKSNAYGLGVARFAKMAMDSGVDAFCITSNKEAAMIRQSIQQTSFPIIRIAPATATQANIALQQKLNIQEMVGSLQHAQMLSTLWENLDDAAAPPIQFHLNLDTGMSRMGFKTVSEVNKALKVKHLQLVGVMTHLANAYRAYPEALKLSLEQHQRFEKLIQKLNLPQDVVYHIANSGGALLSPVLHKDMVRAGASLLGYPYTASVRKPDIQLKSVIKKLRTKVLFIQHKLPPNTPVGYSSAFRTPEGSRSSIATISLGFANGIPHNAKGLNVLIRGRRYPIVGEIGMNLSMVDITPQRGEQSNIKEGDEVLIIGKQGGEEITLVDLANQLDFSPVALILQLGQQNVKSTE